MNRRTPSLLLKLLVKKRQLDVRKKNGLWDSLCILAASHVHVCSEVTGSKWSYSLAVSFVVFPFLLFADDYLGMKY